jgi:hypothetical protein
LVALHPATNSKPKTMASSFIDGKIHGLGKMAIQITAGKISKRRKNFMAAITFVCEPCIANVRVGELHSSSDRSCQLYLFKPSFARFSSAKYIGRDQFVLFAASFISFSAAA